MIMRLPAPRASRRSPLNWREIGCVETKNFEMSLIQYNPNTTYRMNSIPSHHSMLF